MSIEAGAEERGVAALFRQPLTIEDRHEARALMYAVYYVNLVSHQGPRLHDIMYRNSTDDIDLERRVYRYDLRGYQDVFQNGFQARPQGDTSDDVYYNLLDHVNNAGSPLDPDQETPRVYVSTTVSSSWRPTGSNIPIGTSVYRYEIYAPGGIRVNETLGNRYLFFNQREIAFVGGIASQYIRAAVEYVVTGRDEMGRAILHWADQQGSNPRNPRIFLNINFSPQSSPLRQIRIQNPIYYHMVIGSNGKPERMALSIVIYRGNQEQDSRNNVVPVTRRPPMEPDVIHPPIYPPPPTPEEAAQQWYTSGVFQEVGYINAALKRTARNQCYLFMKNEYVLMDYAPGSTADRVLDGPRLIKSWFPLLGATDFAEHGIDCAFGGHTENDAHIFCLSLCARIVYDVSGSGFNSLIKGPMLITEMFPFFKGTIFEEGVDAAFEATSTGEAYLFKGGYYALINYNTPRLIHLQHIAHNWGSLTGTIFERDIDAAFAAHSRNEAYLFKGSKYVLINFAPGSTNDHMIGGIKDIVPNNWPSLVGIVPRPNRGLDTSEV